MYNWIVILFCFPGYYCVTGQRTELQGQVILLEEMWKEILKGWNQWCVIVYKLVVHVHACVAVMCSNSLHTHVHAHTD